MMTLHGYNLKWGGITIGVFAVLITSGILLPLLKWLVVIMFGAIGFILGLSMVLCSGKKYHPPTPNREPSSVHLLLVKMMVRKVV